VTLGFIQIRSRPRCLTFPNLKPEILVQTDVSHTPTLSMLRGPGPAAGKLSSSQAFCSQPNPIPCRSVTAGSLRRHAAAGGSAYVLAAGVVCTLLLCPPPRPFSTAGYRRKATAMMPPVSQRGLLCISVAEQSLAATLQILEGREMAEIRIDLMYPAVSKQDLCTIFGAAKDMPIIVTVREVGGEEGWGELRRELLLLGIRSGATHVDIEVEAPDAWKAEMIAEARKHSVKVIVSHHNYERTPPTDELTRIIEQCFATVRSYLSLVPSPSPSLSGSLSAVGIWDGTKAEKTGRRGQISPSLLSLRGVWRHCPVVASIALVRTRLSNSPEHPSA
jgi:hypothetical protein